MSLYAWVILLSFLGPFLLSFDKKVAFFREWKYLLPATGIVFVIFVVWDSFFTSKQIWGFNPAYLSGKYLANLPIEEVLFFVVIPYCCLFIHQVLKAYFPSVKLHKLTHLFAFTLVLAGFIFGATHLHQWYTVTVSFLTSLITIGVYFVYQKAWYHQFVFTYLVCLIPFIVVNSILTGSFTPTPIVWYAENHIMGIRIFTIPVEDLFYNYLLLLPIVYWFETFKTKKSTRD